MISSETKYNQLQAEFVKVSDELARFKASSMSHSRSAGDFRPRKMNSLRSESTTALGTFFEGNYHKRQLSERRSLEKQERFDVVGICSKFIEY